MEQRYHRLMRAGQFDAALAEMRRLKEAIRTKLGERHANYALALNYEANAIDAQGQLREAEALYREAASIDRALVGFEINLARDLSNLADNLQKQSRYDEAEAMYREAVGLSERADSNSLGFGVDLSNLAVFYTKLGRFADAEGVLRRAMPIFQKVRGQDRWTLGTALSNLAAAVAGQKRYDEAEVLYKSAYSVLAEVHGPEHWQVANESFFLLAKLYHEQKRYEDAERLYKRVIVIFERTFGNSWGGTAEIRNHLARLYLDQGWFTESEELYRQAQAMNERFWGETHPLTADSLNGLARVTRARGDASSALSYARKTTAALRRTISLQSGSASEAGRVMTSRQNKFFQDHIGILAFASAQGTEDAKSLAREAFEVGQWAHQSSAAAALEKTTLRFAAGTGALADLVRESQDLSAYWRGRNSALTTARAQPKGKADMRAIELIRKELTDTETRLSEVTRRLEREFPNYAELVQPKPLKVEELQMLLRPEEGLLFFLVAEEESFAFAVTNERFEWASIQLSAAQLADDVTRLRQGLDGEAQQEGNPRYFNLSSAHKLYRMLIGPLEQVVASKRHLIVVPSGPLTSLPFHLLVTDQPPTTSPDSKQLAVYRSATWLIKRQAISIMPSISGLRSLRTQRLPPNADRRPMLGYGDPVLKTSGLINRPPTTRGRKVRSYESYYKGGRPDYQALAEGLSPLPETAAELRAVASKLGAPHEDLRLGHDATEASVKRTTLSSFKVVYFATHGLIAGELRGLTEPALVLTLPQQPTELDDGLLTASEVTQLKLDADWVVLSACNTAAGDSAGADALSGLAQAFFYAGARALLVSHWRVDSEAAARITTSTFENLRRDPLIGRAEALRRAMLAYMNDPANPWNAYPDYWGPFSIIGAGGAQ